MNETKTVQDWETEFNKGLAISRSIIYILYTHVYECVTIIIIKDNMNSRSRRKELEVGTGWVEIM